MIDVFTFKRIFPDCPFKSNQRQAKIVFAVRCTPRRIFFFKLCIQFFTCLNKYSIYLTTRFVYHLVAFIMACVLHGLRRLGLCRLGLRLGRLCLWPLDLDVWPEDLWCSDHLPLLLATRWVCNVQLSFGVAVLGRLSGRGVSVFHGLEAAIGGQLMSSEIVLVSFWYARSDGWTGSFPHRARASSPEIDSVEGHTPRSFLKIWIYHRNRKRIREYFGLFVRGPDGFES